MRLLVTGGAGFIGAAFVRRRLATTADTITVIDKLTYAGDRSRLEGIEASHHDRLRFVQGDIGDAGLVRSLVSDVDAVVNLAAETHVDRSITDASSFLTTNVVGVHVLLEAVRAVADARPVRFVQVSTDEVYGDVAVGHSTEADPLAPRSPYAASKAAAELLCRAYHETYGMDVVITRGANTFGPTQHPEKLVPLFITNAIQDLPLPLYGDGMQTRGWLYVDDHADAIGFVLDRGRAGDAYNIPGSRTCTNRDITDDILRILAKPWDLVRTVADRPGHDRRYALDGSRLAALGWQPSVPFDDALARTVDWFVRNRAWWEAVRSGTWDQYYGRQYGERLARSTRA